MKNSWYYIAITTCLLQAYSVRAQSSVETRKFPSEDGVMITADYYLNHPDTVPLIILFHQAGWSRGEYLEIAPKLKKAGFNCLAVDLRSGNEVNGVRNQTNASAKAKMKPTQYLDAYRDMVAALTYAHEQLNSQHVIIWGSSYSAALAIRLASERTDQVYGIMAFSPGEYFRSFGKPADYIAQYASSVTIPAFITSARNEAKSWQSIYESIPTENKTAFIPETSGNHGSRALWQKYTDHKAYWASVLAFLENLP
jgi:dienelactone hydrolase